MSASSGPSSKKSAAGHPNTSNISKNVSMDGELKSLLVLSADAKIIILVQSAIDGATLFPPKFSTMFPKKEVIGLVTKIDLEGADIERSKRFLLEAGATEVFIIGLNDKKGLEAIKKRLVMNES